MSSFALTVTPNIFNEDEIEAENLRYFDVERIPYPNRFNYFQPCCCPLNTKPVKFNITEVYINQDVTITTLFILQTCSKICIKYFFTILLLTYPDAEIILNLEGKVNIEVQIKDLRNTFILDSIELNKAHTLKITIKRQPKIKNSKKYPIHHTYRSFNNLISSINLVNNVIEFNKFEKKDIFIAVSFLFDTSKLTFFIQSNYIDDSRKQINITCPNKDIKKFQVNMDLLEFIFFSKYLTEKETEFCMNPFMNILKVNKQIITNNKK
jgi:hypothetical protein